MLLETLDHAKSALMGFLRENTSHSVQDIGQVYKYTDKRGINVDKADVSSHHRILRKKSVSLLNIPTYIKPHLKSRLGKLANSLSKSVERGFSGSTRVIQKLVRWERLSG
mgnify:FL=1